MWFLKHLPFPQVISELEGKDINEVISEGMSKLASMPTGTLDVHVFLVYFSSCSLSARHTCTVSHPQVLPLVILVASVQEMVASMFERLLLADPKLVFPYNVNWPLCCDIPFYTVQFSMYCMCHAQEQRVPY